MKPAPHDAFGPENLAPSQEHRRWDDALLLFGLVAVAVYALVTFLVHRTLPFFGSPTDSLTHAMLHPAGFRGIVALAAAGALGMLAFIYELRPKTGILHIAGPVLLRGKIALREAMRISKMEGQGWLDLVPGVLAFTKRRANKHILILGGVGSGKTVTLLNMLASIYTKPGARSFVYDVKGDFTKAFYDPARCILLSPWDSRSRFWAIGHDLRTESEIAAFCSALIPQEPGSNAFFSISAREVAIGLIQSLRRQHESKWAWIELRDTFSLDPKAIADIIRVHRPLAHKLIADTTSNTTSSVLATLSARTTLIGALAEAWKDGAGMKPFSMRAFLHDSYTSSKKHLIVQGGADASLTRQFVGSLVDLVASKTINPAFAENESREIFIALDELPNLGRLEGLLPLLALGRSKGLSIVACIQDLALLRESLGPERTEAISSLVGTLIICRQQISKTAQALSDLFPRARVACRTSAGVHEETRAVVPTHIITGELGVTNRGDRVDVKCLVAGLGEDILMLDVPGQRFEPKAAALIRNDWARGLVTRPEEPTLILEEPTAFDLLKQRIQKEE